ncbi:efflux RND transporter permease subunit [Arthrobacter monumenti]
MFRLAKLSLANRALIALITVFVAVFGVISMGSLKQELIPSLEFPQVTVISSMPGASPQVVDEQVSEPLESALQAVEGLESSSATSRTGVSTINLTFAYGTNLDRARSQVDRAISNAGRELPDDVDPQPLAGSISDFPILFMAVSSNESLSQLKSDLERLTVPALQKIEGVRSAEVTGGATQHIEILPDDDGLAATGLAVTDIREALENSGELVPVGTIEEGDKSLTVQIGSPLDSLEAIRSLPLQSGDAGADDPGTAAGGQGFPGDGSVPGQTESASGVVTIGDVASVDIVDDEATSITRTNGEETLALSVTKKPDGDTVAISHAITDMLPQLEAELGSGAEFTTIFDQAPFIEQSIDDLTTEGLLGLAFAVVVILVFLLSVRSTLVTAISIPLSLLVTFIGLYTFGYSLNIITLGALTISIGRVVDDSIVVIENIKRHLSYGEEKRHAILTAIREVAGAITASTLTTVAVFLPIAFVGDLAGELFRPFALTVTIALLGSLAVALTIVPVLAYWFLKSPRHDVDPAQVRTAAEQRERKSWLQRGYLPVLGKTQKHPVITLIAGVLVLGGTLAMTPLLQTNLLGDSGQNSFGITQALPPGTSLETTSEAAADVEDVLAETTGIREVQVTIGNATGGFAAQVSGGASEANFTVITDPEADQPALQDRVRQNLENEVPGDITVSAARGGFGTASNIDVDITASNADDLRAATDAVVDSVTGVDGAGEISSNLSSSQPVVQVNVDRAAAAEAGLNEEQISGLLASTVSPLPAGTVRIETDNYPVLIGEGREFDSVDELRNLQLPTASGPIALTSVAEVREVEIPTTITSSDGQRTARVSITPANDNLGALSTEIQERVDSADLPAGTTATLGGATTEQAESFAQLGLALLAAVAIVYVIMVATFKSLAQPLILLVSVPFAATGAIALLLVTQVPLGLPSLIGMLMLVGIVVTNAIVLIDLINQYRRPHDGSPGMSVADAITHGARQRLRPILMTALATIFALTPMALGLTGEGGFISQPLAIVVVGGLISSTALTLILVPVLYRLLEGRRERRALERAEREGDSDGDHRGGADGGSHHRGRHASVSDPDAPATS